jgi:hypothetical protein
MRGKRIWISLSFLAGLMSVLVYTQTSADSSRGLDAPSYPVGPTRPPSDISILVAAEKTTLEQAQNDFPKQLHRPDGVEAADNNLSQVFYQPPPGGPAVELQYLSGVRVILELEWIGNAPEPATGSESESYDPPSDFGELVNRLADQAAQSRGDSTGTYVADTTHGSAFLVPYRPGTNTGSIMLSLPDGVRVTIYGDLDRQTLIDLADSLS